MVGLFIFLFLQMDQLFQDTKDTRIVDTVSDPGFDTRPLINRFGSDVTWRDIFLTDDQTLMNIPGYGPSTVNRIRVFIS